MFAAQITPHAGDAAMKPPNSLLKLAVIASSVLLLSGFVAYRAGAFNWLFTPTIMSSSKSHQIFGAPATTQEPPTEATTLDPTIMYSSKSMAPLIVQPAPISSGAPPAGTTQLAPTILPGSKSAILITPSAPKAP